HSPTRGPRPCQRSPDTAFARPPYLRPLWPNYCFLGFETIEFGWVLDAATALIQNVGIDHPRPDVAVTKEFTIRSAPARKSIRIPQQPGSPNRTERAGGFDEQA